MGRLSAKSRVYKDTTAQQLRSFHETARLGSFSAAAKSLGLANPTVWQQVRALELDFGERLLEPRGRGCRLTEAGRLLADLIGPLVSGAATLKRRFSEARAQLAPRLVLAASPRILAEDLPECAAEFHRCQPDVQLTLKELWDDQILAIVESGEADVGLLHDRGPDLVRLNPWLEFQPVYEVDITLVTPIDHPLALRRHVRPADLAGYPLLNGLRGIPDLSVTAVLDKAGVSLSEPKLVEAIFTATVCEYVRMGFGIGLIFSSSLSAPHPGLHHRVMNRHFGGTVVYQVRRKGAPPFQSAITFMDVVKERLKRVPKSSSA
ncbi:DNA-binding transcriptional regulator, LysR family [Singulisphaera sp. GP187]|uniref:LysR family transcriptional regulator n=1 Tax=Singulisphaera sp. GP187 TaxID=1882752 RepID=UPI00092AF975|nr:LysR family transcriptional regulator [Singulisphaera sp. GP187]SIO58159.1 DNA-binding transcriptional regulator, LysR family [Singulisphaera sp. GP187]